MGRLKLAWRVLVGVGAASLVTAGLILPGVLFVIGGIVDRAGERELRGHYESVMAQIEQEAATATALSLLVAELPAAQAAMVAGERDALLAMTGPAFRTLRERANVDQFQFHTPPATSFLRVHQPAKFGDDLSSFRATVVETNRARQAVRGLEGGVAGLGIRGVVPVVHAGRHLGSVEFGMSFGKPFFERLKARAGIDLALHLPKGEKIDTFVTTGEGLRLLEDARYRAVLAGESVVAHATWQGAPHAVFAGPVKDYSGRAIGVLELAMDNSEYVTALNRARNLVIAIAGGALVIALVIAAGLARSIARPIVGITGVMSRLADGDSAVEIPGLARVDEVGAMAKAVEVFKGSMIESERLRAAQKDADKRAEAEKKVALHKMADAFEASVKGVVQTVSSAATQMQSSAQTLSSTAERTSQQAATVAAASEEASSNVQTVASASEELSASIAEISRQVAHSSTVANQAVDEANQTNQSVQSLAEAAQKIGDVVKLINDIAGQTNLLALNATIEAARAGEAGKGFAVVASEVKSLANQTAKATEDISSQVGAIQGATRSSVVAIEGIGKTISEINQIATTIASAIEEQGAATQEIARNIQQAAKGTNEVSSNIAGVNQAATETGSASTQMLGAAGELAVQAEKLRAEVDRFLGSIRAA
jgi:methyl-accepting chemotaxis protein